MIYPYYNLKMFILKPVDKITHQTFSIYCGDFGTLVHFCRVEVTQDLKDVNKKISEYQKKSTPDTENIHWSRDGDC